MKPFRFRLHSVHKLRDQERSERGLELQRCIEMERLAASRLQELLDEEDELHRQWRETKLEAGLLWEQGTDMLHALRMRQDAAREALQQAEDKKNEALAAWRDASTKVQSLERLQQRQKHLWGLEVKAAEQRELDDWVTTRSGRQRKEETHEAGV